MVANGELAIVAGSDTTANTLSGVFFYLLTRMFEFERLREEVDRVFPRDEGEVAVDASRLATKMPILNAVMCVQFFSNLSFFQNRILIYFIGTETRHCDCSLP